MYIVERELADSNLIQDVSLPENAIPISFHLRNGSFYMYAMASRTENRVAPRSFQIVGSNIRFSDGYNYVDSLINEEDSSKPVLHLVEVF